MPRMVPSLAIRFKGLLRRGAARFESDPGSPLHGAPARQRPPPHRGTQNLPADSATSRLYSTPPHSWSALLFPSGSLRGRSAATATCNPRDAKD